MSAKKASQSEELEKQYRDYKSQFEQWKEKNRDSIGTEAYIKYVKQFEDWERDVEKRRAQIRIGAEQEAERSRIEAEKKREAEIMQRRHDEAAALAYAEEQGSYMAMHQQAMQDDYNSRARLQQPQSQQRNLRQEKSPSEHPHTLAVKQYHHSPALAHVSPGNIQQQQRTPASVQSPAISSTNFASASIDSKNNSMMSVMQQVLSFVSGAADKTAEIHESPSKDSGTSLPFQIPQEVPPPHESTAAPPQLWGAEGAMYSTTDPMFRKWNVRAAPPNFRVPYQPPPPGSLITPGWYMLKKLNENKLSIFTPQPLTATVLPPLPTAGMLKAPLPLLNFPLNVPPPNLPNLSMPPPIL